MPVELRAALISVPLPLGPALASSAVCPDHLLELPGARDLVVAPSKHTEHAAALGLPSLLSHRLLHALLGIALALVGVALPLGAGRTDGDGSGRRGGGKLRGSRAEGKGLGEMSEMQVLEVEEALLFERVGGVGSDRRLEGLLGESGVL